MADMPDLPAVLERLLESGDHESVGAYALESLPAEERIAFEVHLRTCEQCQAELQVLQQSALILRRAIVPSTAAPPLPPTRYAPEPETPAVKEPQAVIEAEEEQDDSAANAPIVEAETESPEPEPDNPPDVAELPPTPELAEELAPALLEVPTTPAPEPAVAEVPAKPVRRSRPRGRVSPGVQPSPESLALAAPPRPSRLPWIVAALGLLFGVGAILAALALAETKGNLEDEIAFQNTQIDELNAQRDAYLQQTSAIVWELAPTTEGTPGSRATVFADPGGSTAILSASGLPALGDTQTYQIWYVIDATNSSPGPTFSVDSTGNGVAQLQADLANYLAIAVTIEPASGGEIPSTNPVLQGFFTTQ